MTIIAWRRPEGNIDGHYGVGKDDFVAMRKQRETGLSVAELLLP